MTDEQRSVKWKFLTVAGGRSVFSTGPNSLNYKAGSRILSSGIAANCDRTEKVCYSLPTCQPDLTFLELLRMQMVSTSSAWSFVLSLFRNEERSVSRW